jgi:hypothetical protein
VDNMKGGRLGSMRWQCGSICTTNTPLVDPQLLGLPVLFLYPRILCQTDFAGLLSITDAEQIFGVVFGFPKEDLIPIVDGQQ